MKLPDDAWDEIVTVLVAESVRRKDEIPATNDRDSETITTTTNFPTPREGDLRAS